MDTLNSIALKFNNTPNQLVQLNRLYSHSVVPGQVSKHDTCDSCSSFLLFGVFGKICLF